MPELTEEEQQQREERLRRIDNALVFDSDDIPYEEDIIRNQYSVKAWLRYILHKKEKKVPANQMNIVYERALRELPGSYKLWYDYLRQRRKQVRGRCITDPDYDAVNSVFERALVFMHKMPRIWYDYCHFLTTQYRLTRTRKTFDRALRALPVTQHDRIWPLYIEFIQLAAVPAMAVRVYRRYMKLIPEHREQFVEYLQHIDMLDDTAIELAKIVNDEKFQSVEGKTHHQLWHELCELISKNPTKVHSLRVEPIIRQGIKRYTDQVGLLWCSLAEYYIRSANFEKARDIYEEAIQTVATVRDFTQVFDAYTQFEERIVSAQMEKAAQEEQMTPDMDLEVEMRLARFEHLMDRRPLLLNSVLLRQNPHNVHEWHKRAQLYQTQEQKQKVIDTYTEAVHTVQPRLATGKFFTLWTAFAKYYESNGQLNDARTIFEQSLKVPFSKVDDLATIWCEYAEMELRHDHVDNALRLMKRATSPPGHKVDYFDESESVENRVYKSLKLWSMYADLEESFGTFEATKSVYERMIELRIATPQIVINACMYLEEHNHFEESFKTYERGIALFKWPNVYDIWNTYLMKFVHRYGGKKLERARDLFEQCLEHCPAQFAKNLFLMYAKLEEEHGLARHAMAIYNRATRAVDSDEKYDVYNIYIAKAAEMYGITYTRPIYEDAIENLPEGRSRDMCIRFAELERKLGEIDRARAVYRHCSQMCDPRLHASFWDTWKDFEVAHGNEDTVREMLRIKRSVQATYNTQVNFMSAQMLAAAAGQVQSSEFLCVMRIMDNFSASDLTAGDSMVMLEARAQQMAADEVRAKTVVLPGAPSAAGTNLAQKSQISFVRSDTQVNKATISAVNPDAIDLDAMDDEGDGEPDEQEASEDDEEEEEEGTKGKRHKRDAVAIENRAVPAEVFGGLAKKTHEPEEDDD